MIKKDDMVSFITSDGEKTGCVQDIQGKNAVVEILDDDITAEGVETDDGSCECVTLPLTSLTYLPPVVVGANYLGKFARYEIGFQKLTGGVSPIGRIKFKGSYNVSMEDIVYALNRCRNVSVPEILSNWLVPMASLSQIGALTYLNLEDENSLKYRYLPNEGDVIHNILISFFTFLVGSEEPKTSDEINEYIDDFLDECQKYIEMRSIPVPKRDYSEDIKEGYILSMNDELGSSKKYEISLYKKWVNELCKSGNMTAMKAKAYGCYGGNEAFECDWKQSSDLFLRLAEVDADPAVFNTLGYIYYYGRCGKIDYSEAFKYFSLGAMGGIFESIYKLSDMLLEGKGIAKNQNLAVAFLEGIYEENHQHFLSGVTDCKYADIALRLGNLAENGVGMEKDCDKAFRLYLEALCAIKRRIKYDNFYGDSTVLKKVRQRIAAVLPKTSYLNPVHNVEFDFIDDILEGSCPDGRLLRMTLTHSAADATYSAKVDIAPEEGDAEKKKLLVVCPESHHCAFASFLALEMTDVERLIVNGKKVTEKKVSFTFDKVEENTFWLHGKKVALLDCSFAASFSVPDLMKSASKEKYTVVSVRFGSETNEYDYLTDISDIAPGDHVVVETSQGEEQVTVASVTQKTETELDLPVGKYKYILWKA